MKKLPTDKISTDILNLQGMVMQIMSVKKQIIRALVFVLILSSVAISFTGCGGERIVAKAYRSIAGADVESQVLASDSVSELSWDLNAKAIVYKTKENGVYWSDILYDSFLAGDSSVNANSPIGITVVDTKTFKEDTIMSASQIGNMNIVCKKIENGIRVTYFFDTYKIAVPMEYTMVNGALKISIITTNILEDGTDFKLRAVLVAPYLCSVPNGAKDGNLLVPTGTGALMNSAENADGARKYTGEVYGADAARRNPYNLVDDEFVRLPVYGAYGDGKGILAVIDEGAGAVDIVAQAGETKRGYSNVYATFNVRGYDRFEFKYHGDYQGFRERVNENISTQPMSVMYYPLYDDEANYIGMAQKYREYLKEKGLLEESNAKNNSYSVSIWGGTGTTESILGIPNKKTVALTTFSQANTIVSELGEEIGTLPTVRLYGYGNKGLSSGQIAGGKNYLSVYGNKKDLAALIKTTENTDLFMDSDVVNFNQSGAGFRAPANAAKTAVLYKAEQFKVTPIRTFNQDVVHYAVQRSKLADAAAIAVKKAQKYGNNGISLSTIGTTAYSDYNSDEYISKSGIDTDVKAILDDIKKQGYKTAVAGANAYAACAADSIFDVAINNGEYSVFDEEIPFYQLVFHSYRPMYSDSVNLYENMAAATAKAVAYGMGLNYAITGKYVSESDDLDEYKLYAVLYEDNKENIYDTIVTKGYQKIYSATAEAQMKDYSLSENGVSTTTYSNGVKVYVNHTNNIVTSPVGELAPYAFSMS